MLPVLALALLGAGQAVAASRASHKPVLMKAVALPPSPRQPELEDPALMLKDVVVSRYSEEPAASGMFRLFRKMTVVENRLVDRDVYILWLSKEQELPKVGSRCDIRYHMGFVGGLNRPINQAVSDSRIMDDYVCKT
ncbi:MAG: hypothetical protein ACXWKW_03650 [Asticcacaulis sp.]